MTVSSSRLKEPVLKSFTVSTSVEVVRFDQALFAGPVGRTFDDKRPEPCPRYSSVVPPVVLARPQ